MNCSTTMFGKRLRFCSLLYSYRKQSSNITTTKNTILKVFYQKLHTFTNVCCMLVFVYKAFAQSFQKCAEVVSITLKHQSLKKNVWIKQLFVTLLATTYPGSSPAGDQWFPAPYLKPVPPHFMFDSQVAAYMQYCIEKGAPLWFLAPLLRHPGDGPAHTVVVSVFQWMCKWNQQFNDR